MLEQPREPDPRARRVARRARSVRPAREFFERTRDYWLDWSRHLSIPFEWQEAVIRAAITLKLCSFEETGAIVAAMTTSIPEAAGQRPQLGLPLLLAARRLLRDPRAEPPRRDAHDGGLPPLHHQHRRRTPRTGTCSRSTASTREAQLVERDDPASARLSRHGAGARRQPGLRARPERRLRQRGAGGDAVLLRRAAARTRAARSSSSGSSASASRPSSCTTSPTPGSGSCARARACTPSRA